MANVYTGRSPMETGTYRRSNIGMRFDDTPFAHIF